MYIPLVELLNLKLRYMGNDKSLLALDALWDIYALMINLARERQEDRFLTYHAPNVLVGDSILVRYHTRDV